MINSANSLEFVKSKLLTMDKSSSTTNRRLLPPSSFAQARTVDSIQERFLSSNEIKNEDRVRVQHLENHTNLQNNKCCNTYRTLHDNISASSNLGNRDELQMRQMKDDTETDVEQLSSTTKIPLDIQNRSALNIDCNNKNHIDNKIAENGHDTDKVSINATIIVDKTKQNSKFDCEKSNFNGRTNNKLSDATEMKTAESQRTEDQHNAYRHIESVHNYAKSKSFEGDDYDKASPNGSRNSSYLSEDDEEDEDNADAEFNNDGNVDYEDRLPDDLEDDYVNIFNKRRYRRFEKFSSPHERASINSNNKLVGIQGIAAELKSPSNFMNLLKDHQIPHFKLNNNKNVNNYEDDDDDDHADVDVDIETVEPPLSPKTSTNSFLANHSIHDQSAAFVKPDHHARRPMNAFLIFCKRHRAIVKDRYKNLENRAITKILGDWWASLESNEKKCFTNLAQQNKDAFFSANPNFKWYKLPAPPLRTLSTRPANTFGPEFEEDNSGIVDRDMINSTASCNRNHGNYFKLADEAHMGDLSQLMQDKSKSIKQCAADLQQALGETSQFMSTHITCNNSDVADESHLKRRFCNESSFSSNSSEEDIMEPKKKSARTCKGKRYQELISSGQIATAVKKSKSLVRPLGGATVGGNCEANAKQNFSNIYSLSNSKNNDCQERSLSEAESMISCDINGFDLEEKIKELPALNLDDYLQRKRNTKKKKKFSSGGKRRGQRSVNNKTNPTTNLSNESWKLELQLAKHHQQPTTAVGSQRRKARKESITRRDVSAIEQEVASLLPLTINGCCYFQEAATAVKTEQSYEKDSNNTTSQSPSSTPTSPIIPVQESSSSPVSVYLINNVKNNNTSNDNTSPSTSDLLILAEVAANRTGLQ